MKHRILVVDDDPSSVTVLEASLAPLGHEVAKATSGRAALAEFAARGADLILLDVLMPDLDGFDVLMHVREMAKGRYVPIVLVTGAVDRESRLRGLRIGADEFVEKPIDPAIVVARVGTLLRLKEAIDELHGRNKDLEVLQQQQRDLAHFLYHDMRNPLTAIAGNVALLREELVGPPAEVTDLLDDLEGSTRALRRLADDVIMVARLEEAGFPLRRESFPVRRLLEDVVRPYAREARERGIEIGLEAAQDLRVEADAHLVLRVVENLLVNALRHAGADGRVALAARHDEGACEIRVANTGQPIDERDRLRIFEKFGRGAGATSGGGDVGLGLYFCRLVAEAHGGTIGLGPATDLPVSFLLRLPRQ